jgi:hypothetical protein
MDDLTNNIPADTEENGYPLTEHYLQMDVFKGISGLIDRDHYEHARAWATLELAEVNYRMAIAAERQAAALEQQKEYTGQLVGQLANLEKWLYNLHEQEFQGRLALNRIAAVLERADNLSQMFGGEA